MHDEKKKWERIEIHYEDYSSVRIHRKDLDEIEAISDVIDALQQGKALTEKLKNILK